MFLLKGGQRGRNFVALYLAADVQTRLVLVVSEICARGYDAGRARAGGGRGAERLVGRSAAGAAVGVAEAE